MGRAYWLIDRNPVNEEPDRIWLLMPQCVTPVFDADGVLIEYKYRVGRNGAQTYAKEDVIDFRLPALDNPYSGGQSPLSTVYSQVTVAGKLTDYVNNVLDNRARPEALLIPKGDPSDDVAKRALAKFNSRVSGKGNGGTVVLDVLDSALAAEADPGEAARSLPCRQPYAADL
jgi:phage portal protein BeeE